MDTTIRDNLLKIREDIELYTPNIIAVTKYFDESKIIEAYDAGLRDCLLLLYPFFPIL